MTPPLNGLTALLGFEYTEVSPDRVVIDWDVTPDHHQPFGIVHGGVYCAVIETAASVAAWAWLQENGPEGSYAVGVSNQTDFLRAISEGHATAVATPIHRGRSQQLWQVDVTSAPTGLVARGQVRLQNLTSKV